MPKRKTRKSIAKRFKKTGTGKTMRSAAGRGHLLTGKTTKRKRALRAGGQVSAAESKKIAVQMQG